MPTVSRTFTVTATPDQVLGYLADFGHAEEWDPGTDRCSRIDDGPVRVGASWHNETTIAGVSTELTYVLEEWADDTVVLVGRNDTATSTEIMTVKPDGAGTELTYRNEVELNGAAKLAAPAVKLVFEKIGVDTEKKLTEVLNALSVQR